MKNDKLDKQTILMLKNIDIIIVDDENLFRSGIISLFKSTNIKIIGQAENGLALFSLLKTKKPALILLDLEMPVLNGSKTLNKLRKEFPILKIIIMSKYYDEELIKDMFNRGASAYLSKNSEIEMVINAINRVAEYGIYKDNVTCLLKTPAVKDGHYYRLLLTAREIGIMELLYQSKSYSQIGKELFISENTVENHAKSIYKKIKVKNRVEFGIITTKLGLNYIGGY